MKIKPFIRWAGGKQNLVDYLLNNIPKDNLIKNYYEPFLGAGSLFFANGFKQGLISDINPQLINSYQQIKINYELVFECLTKYHNLFIKRHDFYYQLRNLFNKNKLFNNYSQAAAFIFLIHTNYNGMYRVNQNGDYNVPLGKLNPALPSLAQLRIINRKLKKINIECFDYKNILKLVKANDFVYLDPPYPPLEWNNHQKQYTISNFTKEMHEELALASRKLKDLGCLVLISYPDLPFITELYKDWQIIKLDAFRSISCKRERKKISELIIKNY